VPSLLSSSLLLHKLLRETGSATIAAATADCRNSERRAAESFVFVTLSKSLRYPISLSMPIFSSLLFMHTLYICSSLYIHSQFLLCRWNKNYLLSLSYFLSLDIFEFYFSIYYLLYIIKKSLDKTIRICSKNLFYKFSKNEIVLATLLSNVRFVLSYSFMLNLINIKY